VTERDDEEQLLRSVALQNAQAILLAHQQAEQALLQANHALELKSAELARSLAIMRATLESTTDGILVTDAAGNITGFNEKYLSMWRLAGAVMITGTHHTVLDLVAEEFTDAQAFRQRFNAI
jgi:PAS domain-containing protein